MKHTVGKVKLKIKKEKVLSSSLFTSYFLLFTFCVSAWAQVKVLPKTARLVPPETALLVDVDNFSRLKRQFEKTNLYKLYKDPAMAAFVDNFKTKWREKIRELDNEIAEAIVNADILPQGRLAAAVVLNEQTKNAKEPPILLITQWGENTAKIKEAIDKTVKKAIEGGAHQKTEDYRGVSIITIIDKNTSSQTKEQSDETTMIVKPSKLTYCFVDDCLIFSEGIDVVKFVIAHIKGASSPTLAGDADYTATLAALGPYHDIDFYVNIKQIIKTILAEDTAGKARTTVANLGIDNVAAFGSSVGLGRRPGNSCCGKAFLKINGAKKGVCKMLEVESTVLRAPRFISVSAYSLSFLNLNIKKAYDELYNILYSTSPMAAAIMHAPLLPPSPDGQPGLQLKSDIIDHLGSQIVFAQTINKPFSNTGTPPPVESLIALAVVNHHALEKSLSLLHGKVIAPNDPDARRELLGHTIYLVSPQRLPFSRPGTTPMQEPAGSGAPQTPAFAFTITDTHLIYGAESTVERAIRTLSSTTAASVGSAKWFTLAKSAIPSVVGVAGLEDNAASGELFWWLAKEVDKAKASTTPVGPASFKFGSQGFAEFFKVGLLPPFDAVRKYFGLSAFYGISRPDGFFFEFNYLNPSGSN